MNINYENIKAAYYRGQNILKIYSGSTMEWEYETEPMEQTTKQIWYNSVSGDVVEPYNASAMGTVVSNTAYETKCVLEFASDVTAIGANAFSGCTDLEYVSIPVNATSIGDNAFDGCSALDGIYMPSVQRIGRESFKDCAFTAFTIPTSVTAITADAFKGVAMESFNYGGTKAQWQAITTGDFWDEETWITRVVHCSDGDIELYQIDYSKRYLEFVATSDGTLQFKGAATSCTISYSTDSGDTWSTPAQNITINVNSGDSVLWKGEIRNNGVGYFTGGTATFDVQGNILSLAYGDNYKNQTRIPDNRDYYSMLFIGNKKLINAKDLIIPSEGIGYHAFWRTFDGCSNLITAPSVLPATTLGMYAYQEMFEDCTSLTQPPIICATTFDGDASCNHMFQGCTSLTTAPELLPTTLRNECYQGMFQGCTSLTQRPIIHATTFARGCYDSMFSGTILLPDCSNIDFTSASAAQNGHFIGLFAGTKITDSDLRNILPINPQTNNYWLPVTTSVNYNHMFQGCTSLRTTPELPATTLATSAYTSMFQGCTSLTQAPQLPATALADYCYSGMFSGCTSLINAPQLLATALTQRCYQYMFQGCTSLTQAPQLPATALTQSCYYSMFQGCTSLTQAPQLPATTLADWCYGNMFQGCSSLNYIKMLATNISANGCLWNWVDGVANSGTFVKAESMTTLPTGQNGIPNGWSVEDFTPVHDYSQDYLTFVAKEDGTFNFSGSTTANTISYSTDSGDTWSTPSSSVTINVNSGDTVLWKGNMTPTSNGIGTFSDSTATFDAQGNTMSLLFDDNYKNQTSLSGKDYAFKYLFKGSKVVNSENMILPATTLSNRCYTWMFSGCTSLVTAPELPATTMAECSYGNMFEGCSSLTTAPQLPATNLSSEAYSSMFQNCTSLTTAPSLPATTLSRHCYKYMFKGCSSLTTAPELLAASLDYESYWDMFNGCTNLNYIKMLATNISAYGCLYNWVYGVAASGTFVKDANTTLPSGDSGIPNGWTVVNEELPFPVSGFNFNYNFKNYDSATHTVPNESGASWNQDLVLQGTPVVDTDHITVTDSDAYAQFPFASNDANIFNLNNTDKREMTVIFKVGNISGADSTPNNLINNRGSYSTGGNDNMNWMVRPKQTICALHDSSSEKASVSYSTKPNVFVMTVSNGTVTNKSITDNVTSNGSVNFTAMAGRICFFCANLQSTATDYITSTERFSGVCYWMFQANRVLTDAEITQVINYNENL